MFDIYYRSLKPEQKEEFCKDAGISENTVRIAYLRRDPLKRRAPRPETMLQMIIASKGKLNMFGLLGYFYGDVMIALTDYEKFKEAQNLLLTKRKISVIETE